jgi:hypothetical protein
MAIKKTLELDVSKGTNKEELQRFLDLIPEAAKVSSEVSHQMADRPWESESYTLTILAEWSE